ncbi:MAG: CvpA family protein [Clostridiales bacterium]|nr:CvpA family protein [Clostridiales bacterium]
MKGKSKLKLITGILLVLFAAVYYYVTLPAINFHSTGTWMFLIAGIAIVLFIYSIRRIVPTGNKKKPLDFSGLKTNKIVRGGAGLLFVLIVIFCVGTVLSSPIINASKYQKLLTVEEGVFSEDIQQISYDQIPMLDRNSASILGNRKMGSLVDLASQFVVSDYYCQINYQGDPVRVTPLNYASLIKWFTNMREGIPAYIKIDMATQDTELVRLEEGMKYTPYDHFNRNLYRHLRFKYPTYIFDDISFEIDEEGTPMWICSVAKYNVGLFGGRTIGRVVVCNAITGECDDYSVEEAPTWIDRVYSADMLVELYDYYGTLKHGFLNSIMGQKDCLKTTNGYNYLAIDDDVWVYTGVTSITSDQSNVGFVLMNERTMETKYYQIEGAIEDSAMSSAEGKVQNLKYEATFPLLLNIANEPTYFIALKDDSGLVKMYAMVNVQKYQVVATGDSVSECEKAYISLLKENGINSSGASLSTFTATGVITKITEGVVDGNSHYYIMLQNDENIYDVTLADFIQVVRLEVGDSVDLEYLEGVETCTVLGVTIP